MATIAIAEVELIPSIRGGAAAIAKELGGTKAGELAGREIGAAMTPQVIAAGGKAGEGFAARFRGAAGKVGAGVQTQLTEAGSVGGREGGLRAGEGLRAGVIGGMRGLGGEIRGAAGLAGHEAGEVAGHEAGEGFGKKFLDSAKELAAPLLAYFGAEKITEFFKSSVEAGESVEKTNKLIEISLRNTGAAAGITMTTVDALATSIGQNAGVARDQILSAEQSLLRFANVGNTTGTGNDIFSRATADAADLAAVMKTDVPSAAALLGKALNNPTSGLGRLTRAGVAFTAQQVAQIKAMAKSGDVLDAQKIILGQFEKQFSGAAAHSATASDRFKASVTNLKDTVGVALLPEVSKVVDGLAKFGTTATTVLTDIAQHNDVDLAKTLGVQPGSPLIKNIDGIRDGLSTMAGDIKTDLPKALPALKELGGDIASLQLVADSNFVHSMTTIADGITKVLGPLDKLNGYSHGSLFQAFAASVPGVGTLNTLSEGLKGVTTGLGYLGSAAQSVSGFFDGSTTSTKNLTGANVAWTAQAQKNEAEMGRLGTATTGLGQTLSLSLSSGYKTVGYNAKQAATDTKTYTAANAAANAGLTQLETNLSNLGTQYFGIANASDAFQSGLNAIVTAVKASKTGISGTSDAAIAARTSIRTAVQDIGAALSQDEAHHIGAAKTLADYTTKRSQLVQQLSKEGLTSAQISQYTGALSHVPAVIKTQAALDSKAAAARSVVYGDQLKKTVPAKLLTQVGLAGQNTAITDALIFRKELAAAVPGALTVPISLSVASAAYGQQLHALEQAGGSPVFAAQTLKNRSMIPHFANGGPVYGSGGPTSDSVLAALSPGEDVVNAAAYARNRRAVDAMNAGATLTAPQPVVHVQVRNFFGNQEMTALIRTEVDAADAELATYLRSHPAMAG